MAALPAVVGPYRPLPAPERLSELFCQIPYCFMLCEMPVHLYSESYSTSYSQRSSAQRRYEKEDFSEGEMSFSTIRRAELRERILLREPAPVLIAVINTQ